MMTMRAFFGMIHGIIAVIIFSAKAYGFENGRVNFTLKFQGMTSNLQTITTSVMPGETLEFESNAIVSADQGVLTQSGHTYTWLAPENSGLSVLRLSSGGQSMLLNVFTLVPFRNGQQTMLNGYKIGRYSQNPFRGLSRYKPPRGFIEYRQDFADLKISPHFTLSQFLCKQQPGHDPTYVLILPATLLKLEALLEAANAKGWAADSFHIMSGFRTPAYNLSIGNKTTSSRHLFGGATDIWLDGDGDGQMHDLNGDGRVNKDDARALAKLAEQLASKDEASWHPGGIGVYGANAAHGPFVHIDARGYRARWGH